MVDFFYGFHVGKYTSSSHGSSGYYYTDALEVKETNILKIVPDGIVDEANHCIYHGLFQKTLYLTVFGPPGDGFIVYRDQS